MPACERWSSLFACSLVWLVPFVIFLRHHDYALWRADVALAAVAIAGVGLLFGLLLSLGPPWVRVAVAAFTISVFLDLQTSWIREAWRAGVVCGLAGLVLWPARALLGRGLAFLAVVMILTTLPLSPGDGWIHQQAFDLERKSDASLPPILHLVLDEHTALDAIPARFDPGGRLRRELARPYLDLGFRVYPRAFSRHFTTPPSLSHLVNLSADARSYTFYDPDSKAITRNAYFEAMSARGYHVQVLQTDYLDLCSTPGEIALTHCTTYTLESIKAIQTSGLGLGDRAQAIIGSFGQLSHWLQSWRRTYRKHARQQVASGVTLPEWPVRAGRLSTLSSRRMLPRVERAFAQAQPGTLVFAHLLIPHFPYAYDRNCQLRPSPLEWRTYKDPTLQPTRNSPTSRAERYPLYLEQLACTNRLVTEMLARVLSHTPLRDAVVIVHGDHGSRINLTTPNKMNVARLRPSDYGDAFATHFAIRAPRFGTGIEPTSIAIDRLLSLWVHEDRAPENPGEVGPQTVYLSGERPDEFVGRPMQWNASRAN